VREAAREALAGDEGLDGARLEAELAALGAGERLREAELLDLLADVDPAAAREWPPRLENRPDGAARAAWLRARLGAERGGR